MTSSFAQAPDTMWTRTFGGVRDEMGYSVKQTSDGGYIIAGWTESFAARESDVYLIKTDVDGFAIWEKTYGGMARDVAWSVQQTADGGYIIAGYTYSFGSGDGDVYVIRTDSSGDTLWTRIYGGTSHDGGQSVQITADGGFIIAGSTLSFGIGQEDVYLVKTDSLGNVMWEKTYGDTLPDYGCSVAKTSDDGYIIAGTLSLTAGGRDVYLVKTDIDGDTLWTRTYGGIRDEWAGNVQQTADLGYIIVGFTLSFGADYGDYYLVKTDADGDTIWTKTYGGEISEWGYSVQQNVDSSYVIAGWSDSYGSCYVYFIKVDAFGDTVWTRTYGGIGVDAGFDMQKTADGGYIIVGSTTSFGAGAEDVYLIKISPEHGIDEERVETAKCRHFGATIISGSLSLPKNKKCKVYDITGRIVSPNNMRSGIYFVEIDGKITRKVVKVR